MREKFPGACDQSHLTKVAAAGFFPEAKGRGYPGKVALLSNGDGAGVWPRFISKEITAVRCWHLAGNSERDDLKFFAKDTEAFVSSDKAGTRWPPRVRPTV